MIAPIAAGEAALWQPGEEHAAGTESGMTAIVVESEVLAGVPEEFGPIAEIAEPHGE